MQEKQTWRTRTTLDNWSWEGAGTFLHANRSGYLDGYVATPHGWVKAYTMAAAVNPDSDANGGKYGPTSRVQFIYRGRAYQRSFNKAFSEIGLIRAAHQLARDVVNGRVR